LTKEDVEKGNLGNEGAHKEKDLKKIEG